jgi:hypothetical protein
LDSNIAILLGFIAGAVVTIEIHWICGIYEQFINPPRYR